MQPGYPWRPLATVSTWAKWTQGNGWQTVSDPPQVTPERWQLDAGEWRAIGMAGASNAPAEVLEGVLRVMGYLFEVDPAAPVSMGDVIRRSGAASLFGPHCLRMAT